MEEIKVFHERCVQVIKQTVGPETLFSQVFIDKWPIHLTEVSCLFSLTQVILNSFMQSWTVTPEKVILTIPTEVLMREATLEVMSTSRSSEENILQKGFCLFPVKTWLWDSAIHYSSLRVVSGAFHLFPGSEICPNYDRIRETWLGSYSG